MTLVQNRLHELDKGSKRLGLGICSQGTYVTFEIVVFDVGLDANQVPQHSRHQILAEDDDFLLKELDTAWVGRAVDVRYAGLQAANKGGEERSPGQYCVQCDIQRARHEDEMGGASY